MVTVTDNQNRLAGIITDGDLRRLLTARTDIYNVNVKSVMNTSPIKIVDTTLAVDALNVMKNKKISSMPVLDRDGYVCGGISINHIINSGIIL